MDDDDAISPADWEEMKPLVEELFVALDRPNDVLVEVRAVLQGDGSSSVDTIFYGPFSDDDRAALYARLLDEINKRGNQARWSPHDQ